MSTTMNSGLNGRLKKSLAFQLDRLDTILDGLAEALNGAVADAVRQSVGEAAKEAVKVALAEALPQTDAQKAPSSDHTAKGIYPQAKAKVVNALNWMKRLVVGAYQKVRMCCTRYSSATVLAAQSAWVTVRSRSMRVGMLLGAVASCVVGLFRKDSQKLWWGAGIVLSTMLLESYFGTLGTLLLGGGLLYLTTQSQVMQSLHPTMQRQAA